MARVKLPYAENCDRTSMTLRTSLSQILVSTIANQYFGVLQPPKSSGAADYDRKTKIMRASNSRMLKFTHGI